MGNGAGYARILQDGQGRIYAIWKRYGDKASQYPVKEATLDGPGGYEEGTLFYRVLSGGVWSNPIQLNEEEKAQNSWFATVGPQGNVYVIWSQVSAESLKHHWIMWYYNDYLRSTILNGTSYAAITDLSKPSVPSYEGGAPPQEGAINLNGYVDNTGKLHIILEDLKDGVQEIKYFNGTAERVLYTYPKYNAGNTFDNPPHLLMDERGNDHLIFRPSSSTLESEQIWDINIATNQTIKLVELQKKGITIKGFQSTQGPRGAMAVTLEAGAYSDNTEAYGVFYEDGVWKNVGLTNNAAKEKFFYKEFNNTIGYRTYLSTLTRYRTTFVSIAYDAMGKKSMLITLSADWSGGSFSTSSPSILFSPIDK